MKARGNVGKVARIVAKAPGTGGGVDTKASAARKPLLVASSKKASQRSGIDTRRS